MLQRGEKRTASSCGVVFARWLMAMGESEEGEGGEMVGLVVGEREKRELDLVLRERGSREAKIEEVGKEEWLEKKEEVIVVKEEVVCVPPKNALLLMRCRSDPVKMAALTSRLFGSPATNFQAAEEEEEEEEETGDGNEERNEVGKQLVVEEAGEGDGQESNDEEEADAEEFPQQTGEAETRECETQRSLEGVIQSVSLNEEEEGVSKERACVEKEKGIKEAGFSDESLLRDPNEVVKAPQTELQEKQYEKVLNDETVSLKRGAEKEEEDMKGKESSSCSSEYNKEKEENVVKKEREETRCNRLSSECNNEGIRRSSSCKEKERIRHSFSTEEEARRHSFATLRDARRARISIDKEGRICWGFIIDREEIKVRSEELAAEAQMESKKEQSPEEEEIRKVAELEKLKTAGEARVVHEERIEEEEAGGGEREEEEEEEDENREELPDCLLLMPCEPKLSMEVSRGTWDCSTDFLHSHHHGHSPTRGRTRRSKGKAGVDSAGDGRCVESKEEIQSIESSHQHPPPPRPVPPLTSAVEETLLSGVAATLVLAFEPFVLTRCKSEPVRPSARLAADDGFWKNRHRPVGAISF